MSTSLIPHAVAHRIPLNGYALPSNSISSSVRHTMFTLYSTKATHRGLVAVSRRVQITAGYAFTGLSEQFQVVTRQG